MFFSRSSLQLHSYMGCKLFSYDQNYLHETFQIKNQRGVTLTLSECLACCLRLRWWRCLDWALLSGCSCSVHYLMQPPPSQLCSVYLCLVTAAEAGPKRHESLKINIYDWGYLDWLLLSCNILLQLLIYQFYFKVCQRCGSYVTLYKSRCCPRASWSRARGSWASHTRWGCWPLRTPSRGSCPR